MPFRGRCKLPQWKPATCSTAARLLTCCPELRFIACLRARLACRVLLTAVAATQRCGLAVFTLSWRWVLVSSKVRQRLSWQRRQYSACSASVLAVPDLPAARC
eukprot:4783707-Alexandrium_andersonii.AAC.1